jgi:Undecaprenyl-phosphate glucose phosphotransferase
MASIDNYRATTPVAARRRTAPARAGALMSDLLPVADLLCLVLLALVVAPAYALWGGYSVMPGASEDLMRAALVAAVLAPFILYDKRFGSSAIRGQIAPLIGAYALRFMSYVLVVATLAALGDPASDVPSAALGMWFIGVLLPTVLARALMIRYVRRLQRDGGLTEVIALVGAGATADSLMQTMRQTRADSVEILGVFDDATTAAGSGVTPAMGTIDRLLELATTRRIDWILLTTPPTPENGMLSVVGRLEALSVPIGLCPQHVGLIDPLCRIGYVGDALAVTILADRPISRWGVVSKTALDLILGGVITVLLLPVLAVIAVAIKASSPGPVLFRQRRHAFNNREFEILKFRTMSWVEPSCADALRQTSRLDARVTRVGRFLRASSLDELPQLFNVLKGDMSLVGPRPHAVNMRTEARLGSEITNAYAQRHRVKPGMTGWSQVNGARGATNTKAQLLRRVELDLQYIDNWSLLLDLRILALTPRVVLRRANAY